MAPTILTRRAFLIGAASAALLATTRGTARTVSPNEKLNTAHIGVGGKGRGHLDYCLRHETIVALCDVDELAAAESYGRCPNVPKYKDWRKMLDTQKDIDAVIIATPDHSHAVMAMAAMQLGKHVYVEKPLARTIDEVRRMTEAARRYGVATQMGNQGHATDGVRQTCEMLWSGAIGPVREVHCWSDRPIWPRGFSAPLPEKPIPPEVDWDLWLGPAAWRPFGGYSARTAQNMEQFPSGYMPFAWRGWWDFGTGSLGDMGCHILDAPYWALGLGAPSAVECVMQEGNTPLSGPAKSIVRYDFPAREHRGMRFPALRLFWYDGKVLPPRPEGIPEDEKLGDGGDGSIFIGDDGVMSCGSHGVNPRLHPASRMADYTLPDPVLARLPIVDGRYDESHRTDWVEACKGGKPAESNFDYAGPLTETVLLGTLAQRCGRRFEWDSVAFSSNDPEVNGWLRGTYREGWGALLTG